VTDPSGQVGRRAVVIDDEASLTSLIASYLETDGFEVWQALNGLDGLTAIRDHVPDVVVLDLNLPGVDGIELARQARVFSDAYIIMLTARAEEVDKLIGLAVGADDYMTKPFSPRELLARVRALLRRPRSVGAHGSPDAPPGVGGPPVVPGRQGVRNGRAPGRDGWSAADEGHGIVGGDEPGANPDRLVIGALTVDLTGREVTLAGRCVHLTRTEFDLLAALAARPGAVLTREALLRAVWGPAWVGDPHAADVHLANVRRKLGDTAAAQRFIRTVRGVGYRMGPG
jgi:DNA-binding response OmpR family regulator